MLESFIPDEVDIRYLADRMRAQDRLEAILFSEIGSSFEALGNSIQKSEKAHMGVRETETGNIVCMFGVTPHPGDTSHGFPWLISSPLIEKYPVQVVKWGRLFTQGMLETYEILENVVLQTNTLAISWIKHIGFYVSPQPILIEGEKFLKFALTKESPHEYSQVPQKTKSA